MVRASPVQQQPESSAPTAPSASAYPRTFAQGVDRLPVGLRLAQPADVDRLCDLCITAYKENGFGGRDNAVMRTTLERAAKGDTYAIGLIDGPERIEAMLGLQPCKMWYGGDADWYWADMLFYVHPAHRRSRHAVKLFQFAQWWERHTRTPVILSVFPVDGLERTEALFERYGTRAGSFYLIGDGVFRAPTKAD